MTTTTHNSLSLIQAEEMIQTICKSYASIYGNPYIERDGIMGIEELHDIVTECGILGMPYYFAIRERGTESGTKTNCIERCKVLGAPVLAVKVEDIPQTNLFTVTIRTK